MNEIVNTTSFIYAEVNMWQGWITMLAGLWLTVASFFWRLQTKEDLIVTGIITVVFGFSDAKDWQGVFIGLLGIWILGSGLTNYLVLPLNFFLSGLTLAFLSLICAVSGMKMLMSDNESGKHIFSQH